jgi:REP element-mobilizing transposase RayT
MKRQHTPPYFIRLKNPFYRVFTYFFTIQLVRLPLNKALRQLRKKSLFTLFNMNIRDNFLKSIIPLFARCALFTHRIASLSSQPHRSEARQAQKQIYFLGFSAFNSRLKGI